MLKSFFAKTIRQHFTIQNRKLMMVKNVGDVSMENFKSVDEKFTILATTPTGFERSAAGEVSSKIETSKCETTQGKVYFQATQNTLSQIHKLKSVDNLFLVVKHIPNYIYNENKEKALEDLHQLPLGIPWEKVVDLWNVNKEYCNKKIKKAMKSKSNESELNQNEKQDSDDADVPLKRKKSNEVSFRVSATRVGKKQSFISPEAERTFGGSLNDHTQWKVDLSNYDIEVNLILGMESVMITLSLTTSSLHRRNITHFGITTLRGTIAYNLARVCNIQKGDIVLDPMCGTGCISIEGASEWKDSFQIAGDNAHPAIIRAKANFDHLNKRVGHESYIADVMQWDVTNLPWKNDSIDVIVTDMPFGKRVGSRQDNRTLYPKTLLELSRVAKLGSARACFLTRDKRSMGIAIAKCKKYFKCTETFFINIGGLKACVYLMNRTSEPYQAE